MIKPQHGRDRLGVADRSFQNHLDHRGKGKHSLLDDLIIFRFGGDLFYANINHFTDEVLALIEHPPTPVRWLIIDASAITDIDYSAAQSLCDLLDELSRRRIGVVFGRVTEYLRSDMDRHGITAAVGEARVFRTLHEAIAAVTDGDPSIGSEGTGS